MDEAIKELEAAKAEARKKDLKGAILPEIKTIEINAPKFKWDLWSLPFYKTKTTEKYSRRLSLELDQEVEYCLVLTILGTVMIGKQWTDIKTKTKWADFLGIEKINDIPLLEALTQEKIDEFRMLVAQNAKITSKLRE